MEETEKQETDSITQSGEASPSVGGRSCALCGCATPCVRCDRCASQLFCLSCDDMYHRHPKRKTHLRKAVDSIWGSTPRLRRRQMSELAGDPHKIPIPPPRNKKRERHTMGGKGFFKAGLELGSFGHSKVFDPKNFMPPKGHKSPASLPESNIDEDTSSPVARHENVQIYENDNLAEAGSAEERSPWNATRPNMASPIQVSIPSSSPDILPNGQSFGYPSKPHSQSAADLTGHAPFPFHPPYHPFVHPQYSHSMAHLNCAHCVSSSWSNLVSPHHPSPYFHPMPWGSAQNTMTRHPAPQKHSHGDLTTYPDSSFHYPYPGGGYYPNGPPMVDPHFIKDLHEQAEMQRLKRDAPKHDPALEDMDVTVTSGGVPEEEPPSDTRTSARKDVQSAEAEEDPPLPTKPTEPWECVHCTFINPPGDYICQICCKTSYGNKTATATDMEEQQQQPRLRDDESPLVNRDAPRFLAEAQKVI